MGIRSESGLLALPTEILQIILTFLPRAGLTNARLVCSALAQLGLEELFAELRIVHTRGHFERILEVSMQPYISRCIRSLYYQADIFEMYEDLEDWQRDYWERFPGADRATDLSELFHAHLALCQDQRRMRDKQYDVHCLSQLFRACPKLDTVTLAFGPADHDDVSAEIKFPNTAFEAYPTVSFHASRTIIEEESKALKVLAHAAQALQHPLRKLRLTTFCLHIRQHQRADDEELRPLVQHLRELHIEVDGTRRSSDESVVDDLLRAASPSLMALILQFRRHQAPYYGQAIPWDQVLTPSIAWPKLRSLAIDGASVDPEFAGFLIERVPRLERLSINRLHLRSGGSWRSWLILIGGQLSKLERMVLQGFFSSEDMRDEFDFSDFLRVAKRTAVEGYLVEGGVCPELT